MIIELGEKKPRKGSMVAAGSIEHMTTLYNRFTKKKPPER